MCFPIEPTYDAWTLHVDCLSSKPSSPPPKKSSNNVKCLGLGIKLHFSLRKSATKYLCVETVSGKVLRPYLSVHKCMHGWRGMSPSTWNFGPNWPTPFKNAAFESIFARNVSAIIPTKTVQLSLIGSPLRAFQWASPKRGSKMQSDRFSYKSGFIM